MNIIDAGYATPRYTMDAMRQRDANFLFLETGKFNSESYGYLSSQMYFTFIILKNIMTGSNLFAFGTWKIASRRRIASGQSVSLWRPQVYLNGMKDHVCQI